MRFILHTSDRMHIAEIDANIEGILSSLQLANKISPEPP